MRLSRIFLGTLVVAILASAAEAQHLGDVSLSTTAVNLATNLACTGANQTFTTGTTAGFNNIGQIRHFLSVGSSIGVQKFRAEIDGIDNQGNLYRISDVMQLTGLFPRQGTVKGIGAFPQIQISITCAPGTGTFSAAYAGDFGSDASITGAYQLAQIDHVNFNLSPAGSSQSDNLVQTPFGNSSGTYYFQYNTTSAAGATLAISCSLSAISTSQVVFTATLANNTNVQPFAVPASVCPLMNVQFNTGGGGTSITGEMIFTLPGLSLTDPCVSGAKNSTPFQQAASAQVIAGTALKQTYICSFNLVTAGANNVAVVEGTGAVCVTAPLGVMGGATAATGWNLGANGQVSFGSGTGTIAKTATVSGGANVCILQSAATQTSGVLTWIQAP